MDGEGPDVPRRKVRSDATGGPGIARSKAFVFSLQMKRMKILEHVEQKTVKTCRRESVESRSDQLLEKISLNLEDFFAHLLKYPFLRGECPCLIWKAYKWLCCFCFSRS